MMKNHYEKLKGCRASKNRDEVLFVMEKQNYPLSVEEIYGKVKAKNSSISLSTVYRIIDKLLNLEIIRKAATLEDNTSLYELTKDSHHHYMICTKCKKMIPIDICPIEELEHKISDSTGFNITGHKFELYGECKNCAQKQDRS